MITDTPCRRYLLHLFLQGKSVQEVEDHALLHGLDYGSIQYLILLRERGMPPDVFRPRDPNHTASRDYLIEQGLLGDVPRLSNDGMAAFRAHQSPKTREVLELSGLGGLSEEDTLQLLREHGIQLRPPTVRAYRRLFWSVHDMDRTMLRALLLLRSPDATRMSRLAQIQEGREAETGQRLGQTEQQGSGREMVGDLRLPSPYASTVPERPDSSERLRASQRRSQGNRDLIRQLHNSMPLQERARQAEALKRSHYSDPRNTLAALPPSPLNVALARSYLGLPLDRLELQKAYEVLHTLIFHRMLEMSINTHPEAPLRLSSLATAASTILRISKEMGASAASMQQQIQVMALQTNVEGHYGDPTDFTGGHHSLNPYSDADAANLAEITGKNASRGANQVTTMTETEEKV